MQLEDNIHSNVYLRHSCHEMQANSREVVALCQTAQTLSLSETLSSDQLWRELEHQLLWKIGDAAQHGHQLAFSEANGLAYAVMCRHPHPSARLMTSFVEEHLLQLSSAAKG